MRYSEIINEGRMIVANPDGWKYEILPPKGSSTIYTLISLAPDQDIEHRMEFENLNKLNSFLKRNDFKWTKSIDEKSNAWMLTGSGRADPHGKKGGKDSPAHRKVRTPGTTYSKSRKKYNAGAKPGARDGFVG